MNSTSTKNSKPGAFSPSLVSGLENHQTWISGQL